MQPPYRFGRAELRPIERELLIDGEAVAIGGRAFDLLLVLVERQDRIVAKDELLELVWPGLVVEEHNLYVQINTLRNLIGARSIVTIPGRGYRFAAPLDGGGVIASATGPATDGAQAPWRCSLAVLPFANLSGDPQQDYFADGLVDDIITALARMGLFFVIARNSSFVYKGKAVDIKQVGRELGVRYVLEGSIRKAGNRLRITGQLIEAESGHHVWADRFEGVLDDVFDLQDWMTDGIVTAIVPNVRRAEVDRARSKPPSDLQAYDLVLRALPALTTPGATRAANDEALSFIRRALEIDPHYSLAKALGATAFGARLFDGYGVAEDVKAALRYADDALADKPDHPLVLSLAGNVVGTYGARALGFRVLGFRYDEARRAIERALALSPNLVTVQFSAGCIKSYLGEPDAALDHFQRAMRISPFDPAIGGFIAGASLAHLLAGNWDEALVAAQRATEENPNFSTAHRLRVLALGFVGRIEDARLAARRVLELMPEFTVSRYLSLSPIKDAAERKRFAEMYRAAGLPRSSRPGRCWRWQEFHRCVVNE